jgi:hypothetical protein
MRNDVGRADQMAVLLVEPRLGLRSVVRRLALLAFLNVLVVNLTLWWALDSETTLHHLQTFLSVWTEEDDSWLPMSRAYNWFRGAPETVARSGMYEAVFFQGKTKFQYPPSSLLVFYVLDQLDLLSAGTNARQLNLINWFAAWWLVGGTVLVWRRLSRDLPTVGRPADGLQGLLSTAVVAFLALTLPRTEGVFSGTDSAVAERPRSAGFRGMACQAQVHRWRPTSV